MTQQQESDTALPLNILLIDNYDSFTYNIVQLITKHNNNAQPIVVYNNSITFDELLHVINQHNINCIVISAGPGHPYNHESLGITLSILQYIHCIPILGICIGLQALAYIYGGKIVHNNYGPRHGQLSTIEHYNNSILFNNIPSQFNAIRYNSLTVDIDSVINNNKLRITATSLDDNSIMGLDDTQYPIYTVQYHPESVDSQYGDILIQNFINIAKQYNIQRNNNIAVNMSIEQCRLECLTRLNINNTKQHKQHTHNLPPLNHKLKLQYKRIECSVDPSNVYTYLYHSNSQQSNNNITSIWLDSSKQDGTEQTRFSCIADIQGENSYLLSYQLNSHEISIIQHNQCIKQYTTNHFFADIDTYTKQYKSLISNTTTLPFDFQCGFIGYLSYEMRQITLPNSHIHTYTHKQHNNNENNNIVYNNYPDALFIFVDRCLIYDHHEHIWYAATLIDDTIETDSNKQWLDAMHEKIQQSQNIIYNTAYTTNNKSGHINLQFEYRSDELQYKQLINECIQQLNDGNSYELCLTNTMTLQHNDNINTYKLYTILRSINPAPYSTYMNFDLSLIDNISVNTLTICSSSPERFVRVQYNQQQQLTAICKPIKGTISRGHDVITDKQNINKLENSKKDYAENLMIVDLIRNDLCHACNVDSVHVTHLMCIESYATVHQLVSTITGTLHNDNTSIDTIYALFPPGSMTGAPKVAAVDLLHMIESQQPRGVYSGCIGYISLNGTTDMAVVIRTIVICDSNKISIGSGGAITHQSNTDDEYNEVLLKANALIRAVKMTLQA